MKKKKKVTISIKEREVTVSFLANFFGVDQKTIQNWVRSGMPHESRRPYNFYKCVRWRIDELKYELMTAKRGEESRSHAETRNAIAKAGIIEIEFAKKRAEVITVTDAVREMQKIFRVINSKCRAYPRGNSEELAGIETPAEVEAHLNKTLVNELLTESYQVSDRLLSVAKSQEIDQAVIEDIAAAAEKNTKRIGRAGTRNDDRRGKRRR